MANQLPTGRVVQEQGNGQLPGTFATLQPDNSAIIGMLKTREAGAAKTQPSIAGRMIEKVEDCVWLRIPTIPPCCSEGRRPVVPKDSGRVFRVIAATCSE